MIRSRGGAKPGFDAALAELAQTCSALTRERFPFGTTASRDMAPSDFARLFGPGGLFDEFRRNQLTERVDTSSRPWKARSAAADASMPGTFEQAAAIGALFFPGVHRCPSSSCASRRSAWMHELLQFSIDVDGQLLRFENGPARSKELALAGTGVDAESADAHPAARPQPASAPKSMKVRSPGFGCCCAATGRASAARRHGWPLSSTRAPSKSRRAHPARPTPISGPCGSWHVFVARKQNGEAAAASRVLVGQAARARQTSSAAACRHAGAATGTRWLQRGIALAAATLDGATLRERLGAFAPWRYVALPAPGEIWCGIVVASHDRVGRAFPLTLAERLAAPAPPHESAARLASLLDAAAEGPEALEAAIAALPPRAAHEFEPARGLAARRRPASGGRSPPRTIRSPRCGLAAGAGAAARTARYSARRAPDRERGVVVLVAAAGSPHTRFEAIEPGLDAAAADHAACHRHIVEGRPQAVAAQQQCIAGERAFAAIPGPRSRSLQASRAPK